MGEGIKRQIGDDYFVNIEWVLNRMEEIKINSVNLSLLGYLARSILEKDMVTTVCAKTRQPVLYLYKIENATAFIDSINKTEYTQERYKNIVGKQELKNVNNIPKTDYVDIDWIVNRIGETGLNIKALFFDFARIENIENIETLQGNGTESIKLYRMEGVNKFIDYIFNKKEDIEEIEPKSLIDYYQEQMIEHQRRMNELTSQRGVLQSEMGVLQSEMGVLQSETAEERKEFLKYRELMENCIVTITKKGD